MSRGRANEYGLDLLLRELKGVVRVTPNRYKALCPLHDDHNPSLSVSIGWRDSVPKLLIHCGVCGGVFNEVLRVLGLEPWRVQTNLTFESEFDADRPVARRPSDGKALGADAAAMVERFHADLMANESQLSWICERRGLEPDVVIEAGIGFDGHRFWVPIYEHGRL